MSGPRVLYVVYWGAAEPLGQSLVVPAVRRLARLGVRLTLASFEKPEDLEDRARIAALRESLEAEGIRWLPLRYHKGFAPTSWDVLQGWARTLAAGMAAGVDIVHARTFVGGMIGRLVAATLRAKLVYHNEGFYPDEQADGGFWPAGSALHRITRRIESGLYAGADGLIVLSHRAKAVLEGLPAQARRPKPVIVVPSCVDLDRFRANLGRRGNGDGVNFVYAGAVGGRYRLDDAGRFVTAVAAERSRVRLRVLTRAAPELVAELLARGGLAREHWSLENLPHAAMPAELARHDAGLLFMTRGLSEYGCSPTKVGEYWASGLPVVTTPNVSDTDAIVRRERVGVVVDGSSPESLAAAGHELRELLADPELPGRCRRAAEQHYDLASGCERQLALYRDLAGCP